MINLCFLWKKQFMTPLTLVSGHIGLSLYIGNSNYHSNVWEIHTRGHSTWVYQAMPCTPARRGVFVKFTVTLISCMSTVVLFVIAKWRKLARRAEWTIMAPNHLRCNAWKHFEFNTRDGQLLYKGKTVYKLLKMQVSCCNEQAEAQWMNGTTSAVR